MPRAKPRRIRCIKLDCVTCTFWDVFDILFRRSTSLSLRFLLFRGYYPSIQFVSRGGAINCGLFLLLKLVNLLGVACCTLFICLIGQRSSSSLFDAHCFDYTSPTARGFRFCGLARDGFASSTSFLCCSVILYRRVRSRHRVRFNSLVLRVGTNQAQTMLSSRNVCSTSGHGISVNAVKRFESAVDKCFNS